MNLVAVANSGAALTLSRCEKPEGLGLRQPHCVHLMHIDQLSSQFERFCVRLKSLIETRPYSANSVRNLATLKQRGFAD